MLKFALDCTVVVSRTFVCDKSAAHVDLSAPPTRVLPGHAYGRVMNTRSEVLRLYRSILHVARHWEASPQSVVNSALEQRYIKDEARRLFRRNKEVSKMYVLGG